METVKKQFSFELYGKPTLVVIDWFSLYNRYNDIDEIDNDLKDLGININTFKNELEKPIRKPKCDFDAEIAKDVILDIDKYQNLVLFSGDGDFASTVEFLIIQKAKRVFVMYPRGSFGEIDYQNFNLIKRLEDKRREYAKGLVCRPVDHILQHIIKKEPADCSAGPDTNNVANSASEVNTKYEN